MSSQAVLAPIHRRIVVYGIDILMSFVALVGIQAMLFPINPLLGAIRPTSELVLHAWVTLTVTMPLLLFFGMTWASDASATPGMRIMGLRVRTTSGQAVTRGRALLRALVLLIPFELNDVVMFYPHPIWDDATPGFRTGFVAVYFLLLVYLITAFATARRQGPHDVVAETIVVRGAAALVDKSYGSSRGKELEKPAALPPGVRDRTRGAQVWDRADRASPRNTTIA